MKNKREGFLSIFPLFMSWKMETNLFSEMPVNLYNNAGRHVHRISKESVNRQ